MSRSAARTDPWTQVISDVRQLIIARTHLPMGSNHISIARDGLSAVMRNLVAEGVALKPAPRDAWRLFRILPSDIAEDALTGDPATAAARLFNLCKKEVSGTQNLPAHCLAISDAAFECYLDLGLPYATLIGDKAAKMWISRGPLFGEEAWRKAHPRKNPVVSFWEESGLRLPSAGIHPDSLAMVVDAIRHLGPRPTAMIYKKISILSHRIDWRVLIAFLLSGVNVPMELRTQRTFNFVFSEKMTAELLSVFGPAKSNHEQLFQMQKLRAAPSIEEILMRPSRRPETLDELFTPQEAGSV